MFKYFLELSTVNQIVAIAAVFTFLGVCVAVISRLNTSSSTDTSTVSATSVPVEIYQQEVDKFQQTLDKKEQDILGLLKQNKQRQQDATATPEHTQPDDIQQQKELENQLPAVRADQLFTQTESPIHVAAEASFRRAQIAEQANDYLQALSDYQRAAQLAPNNALYLTGYGTMLQAMDQLDTAIGYFEQALASTINTYGEDHPKVAIRCNNLGGAWRQKGQLDKAISYYEQALAIDINAYGKDHPTVATYHHNLSGAWYQKGQLNIAITYLQLALDGFKNAYGDEDYFTQTTKKNLLAAQRERDSAQQK